MMGIEGYILAGRGLDGSSAKLPAGSAGCPPAIYSRNDQNIPFNPHHHHHWIDPAPLQMTHGSGSYGFGTICIARLNHRAPRKCFARSDTPTSRSSRRKAGNGCLRSMARTR